MIVSCGFSCRLYDENAQFIIFKLHERIRAVAEDLLINFIGFFYNLANRNWFLLSYI